MGHELPCKVRSGGKEASGKALLETNEIIFRGEMRLKIPFVSLKSVVARDGDLHLKWPEGSAVFELGDHADKWAHKILHPKSTLEKLGIKPGLVISTLGMADGNFAKDVRATAGIVLRCESAEQFRSDLFRRGKDRRTRSRKKAGSLAGQRGRTVDRLSQRQAGDYGTASARCGQASWPGRCEGRQLFGNAHSAEVCAAKGEAMNVNYRGRKRFHTCWIGWSSASALHLAIAWKTGFSR